MFMGRTKVLILYCAFKSAHTKTGMNTESQDSQTYISLSCMPQIILSFLIRITPCQISMYQIKPHAYIVYTRYWRRFHSLSEAAAGIRVENVAQGSLSCVNSPFDHRIGRIA
jgi:hypothetical protein